MDGHEEIMERLSMCGVLLLDDLGAEKPSEFSRETLGLIVDRAYREESPVIVTSNFDFKGLAERIDDRTVGIETTILLEIKEFCGASRPSK